MSASLGEAVLDLVGDTTGLARDLEAAGRMAESRLISIGDKMQRAGATLTRNLTLPIVGAGAAAAKFAGDFELQMDLLTVAVRGSGASFEDLRALALKAGLDTKLVGVSASDVAGAMTNFAKAGLGVNAMLGDMKGYLAGTAEMGGAMRAAIDLAAASELSLDEASQLVTTTMSTFGIGADQVSDAMNNYVQSADASVASVSGLADAMSNIGPSMAAFGFGLKDTNTALAILSTRGIVGAESGTALKSMFVNMMSGTKEVEGALRALNVTLYDQAGQMRSMPDIIAQLSNALDLNTERTVKVSTITAAQSDELDRLQKIYSSASQRLADYNSGLKGNTMSEKSRAKAIAEATAQMENAKALMAPLIAASGKYTTATVKMTEEQRNMLIQTIAGSYGMKAMNTLLSEGQDGWDKMTTAISGAATMQESAAARTEGFNAKMNQLKDSVSTALIVIGTTLIDVVAPIVQELTGTLQRLGEAFGGLSPEMQRMIVIGAALVAALGPLLTVGGSIISVLGGIAGITGLFGGPLVLAIAAVVAAIVLVAQNWDTIWAQIQGTVQNVIAVIQGIIAGFVQGAQDLWNRFGSWIVSIAQMAWNSIQTIIQTVLAAVAEFIALHGEEIRAFMQSAWERIQGIISTVLSIIQNTIVPMLSAIAAFIVQHKETIVAIIDTAWNTIRTIVDTVINVIDGILKTVMAIIKGDWETAWNTIKSTVETIWKGIETLWNTFWGGIDTTLKTLGLNVQKSWETFWGGVRTAVETVWGNLKRGWEAFWGDLVGAIGRLKAAVEGAWNSFWGGIRDAAFNFINPIKNAIESIKQAWDSFWNTFQGQAAVAAGAGVAKAVAGTPRAIGGPVWPGMSYLVGEKRPELFVPDVPGRIVPNVRNATSTSTTNYYLTAQYSQQDERSLRDDVRMMQMLAG